MYYPISEFVVLQIQSIFQFRDLLLSLTQLANFSPNNQTRFITAATELVWMAYTEQNPLELKFSVCEVEQQPALELLIEGNGPTIAQLSTQLLQKRSSKIKNIHKMVSMLQAEQTNGGLTAIVLRSIITHPKGNIDEATAKRWSSVLSKLVNMQGFTVDDKQGQDITADYQNADEILKKSRVDERKIASLEKVLVSLKTTESRYRLALNSIDSGLWDWDIKAGEVYVSSRWKTMLGLNTLLSDNSNNNYVKIEDLFERIHNDDELDFRMRLEEHLQEETEQFRAECRMRHDSGEFRWMLYTGMALRDDEFQAYRMAGFQEDITQRKNLEEKLTDLSNLDGLTQIANRRSYDEHLRREWRRQMRSKEMLGVILMDIDYFKLYNDSYGHQTGDDALKSVAAAVSESLYRGGDLVARYGGEEFVCLLPETSIEGVRVVGERLKSKIEQLKIPHSESKASDYVTVSLGGISIIPIVGNDPDSLVKMADIALYKAKENGRNRFELYKS